MIAFSRNLDRFGAERAAYNKLTAFGRNEFEETEVPGQRGIPTVENNLMFGGGGHSLIHMDDTIGWSSQDFINALQGPTVVYVHTHGMYIPSTGVNYLLSDYDELSGTAQYIYPWAFYGTPDVFDAIYQGVGSNASTNYPPYNSGNPPINLAFNDACETGIANDFATAYLWPYYQTGDAFSCQDQAECRWGIDKESDLTTGCAQKFWPAMQQGYVADQARLALVAYYRANQTIGVLPTDDRVIVHVWGDWYTRLHGVYVDYTGTYDPNQGPVTAWYR